MFNICNLVIGYFSKICFLRQIASDQADDLFNRTFFPGVVGITEERLSAQGSVDVLMIHVFLAVIVSDRFAFSRDNGFQAANDRF